MTLDTIPFDEIPACSILIVRDVDDMQLAAIRARVPSTVAIFPAKLTTDVLCITEETMREAGWYRCTAEERAVLDALP